MHLERQHNEQELSLRNKLSSQNDCIRWVQLSVVIRHSLPFFKAKALIEAHCIFIIALNM